MTSAKEDFMAQLGPEIDLDKKKKELEAARINVQYDRFKENEEKHKTIKETKFGTISDERAEELAQESTEYLNKVSTPVCFINKEFKGVVPLFEKNLILIGADSGDGKSTAVANIVRTIIAQQDPKTGKTRRCLVITNEENIVDFYNRITCLIKGWHYVDHDQFTEDQKRTFEQYIKILRTRVTVVDDTFGSTKDKIVTGATTTPEGIQAIFENLLRDGEYYDCILIDYYQGVNESNIDMSLDEYKAQRRLTNILEKYRKIYPAPIVLMCQVNKVDPEAPTPMKYRIMGTKLIYTRATMVLEMIKHADFLMTEWVPHKGRFSKLGQSVKTGYKNGAFVPYDDAFRLEVQTMKEKFAAAQLDKTIGVKVADTKEKVKEPVNG